MSRGALGGLLFVLSCASKGAVPSSPRPADADGFEPAPLATAASTGVSDPSLRALLEAHWAAHLKAQPEFATLLGHAEQAHRVDDVSPEARESAEDQARAFVAQARALETTGLSPSDRDTLAMLTFELERGLGESVCHLDEWMLSARMNPVGWTNSLQQA